MFDQVTNQDRMMCPHCGTLVPWNGTKCPNCLENKYERNQAVDDEAEMYVKTMIGTAVFIGCLIAFGVWMGQPNHGGRGAIIGFVGGWILWFSARKQAVQIGAVGAALGAWCFIGLLLWFAGIIVWAILQHLWMGK